MSKNKLAKFAEIKILPNVVEVPYAELQQGPHPLRGCWNSRFFRNDLPIVLELGCGKGEYTVGLAEKYPQKNFIGVDIKGSRIWHGAKEAWDKKLGNAAFLRTYVELLPCFFMENEVSEIWITFPDPQMKKTRKRLTATNLIQNYVRFLKPGGVIHLKTDSNFLFQYTSELVRLNHFPVEARSADLYASPFRDETLGIRTYYEEQWLGRGKQIKYLRFIPHGHDLAEPEVEPAWDDYRSFGRNQRSEIIKKGN